MFRDVDAGQEHGHRRWRWCRRRCRPDRRQRSRNGGRCRSRRHHRPRSQQVRRGRAPYRDRRRVVLAIILRGKRELNVAADVRPANQRHVRERSGRVEVDRPAQLATSVAASAIEGMGSQSGAAVALAILWTSLGTDPLVPRSGWQHCWQAVGKPWTVTLVRSWQREISGCPKFGLGGTFRGVIETHHLSRVACLGAQIRARYSIILDRC